MQTHTMRVLTRVLLAFHLQRSLSIAEHVAGAVPKSVRFRAVSPGLCRPQGETNGIDLRSTSLENVDGVFFTVSSPDDKPSQNRRQRPFIGLRWDCCGRYTRVYRHVDGTHYKGRCPGCGKSVRIEVDSGGTSSRFFSVR